MVVFVGWHKETIFICIHFCCLPYNCLFVYVWGRGARVMACLWSLWQSEDNLQGCFFPSTLWFFELISNLRLGLRLSAFACWTDSLVNSDLRQDLPVWNTGWCWLNSTLRLGWYPTFSDVLDSASRVPGPQAWTTMLCLMLHFLFETEYSVALTGLQTCNVD